MNFIKHSTLIALVTVSMGAQASELKTVEQKASYSFGVDIVNNLKKQGVELDTSSLIQGIEDATRGTTKLSETQRQQAKVSMQNQLREKMQAELKVVGEKNRAEGEAFLAENKSKQGVVTTDSGLQYKIITAGTGKSPGANDTVVTHYRGTLIDGREFDSSYKRNSPATFPVRNVIKGWTEALQLMKEGAKWQLFIPSDLAYGESKRSELITPNSTLVFDIELIEVK